MELTDEQKRLAAAELLRQSGYNGPTMNGAAPADMDRPQVAIGGGRTAQAVNETLKIARQRDDVFDLGDALVRVHNGRVTPLDRHSASHFFGSEIQYFKIKDGKATTDDPPQRMIDQILALGSARDLRPLEAVTTIPTIRPDGTVIATPGYDQATSLLYVGDPVTVPMTPTADEVAAAFNTLIYPFRLFPFCTPLDWSIMIAALLTAVVRPALPTAPAFSVDAPTYGSGKTLLCKSIAMLATGEEPKALPHVARRDDEEIRKRLFAAVRAAQRVIFWDNATGVLDSPSLAAFLTSPRFQDRVLGRSEMVDVPNNAIFLLSANNVTLAGDLPRRNLTTRIDPKMEQAYARQFDLDPLAYVAENRQRLAVAALTIVRAWLSSGAERAPGRTASFEAWDDLVRQSVAWLARTTLSGQLADPIEGFHSGTEADPKREAHKALIDALYAIFGHGEFTAAEIEQIIRRWPFTSETDRALASAVKAIAGSDRPNAVTIGHILKYRRGRIVDGWKFEARSERGINKWVVEWVIS